MAITYFRGEHWYLSNFFPVNVEYKGLKSTSAEHLYQAFKTSDPAEQQFVLKAEGPWEAKKRGRRMSLRTDWDNLCLDYMYGIVKAKFDQHEPLAKRLVSTGDQELVEGNHWGDTYWGVCRGQGENHLGKILMRVRSELRA